MVGHTWKPFQCWHLKSAHTYCTHLGSHFNESVEFDLRYSALQVGCPCAKLNSDNWINIVVITTMLISTTDSYQCHFGQPTYKALHMDNQLAKHFASWLSMCKVELWINIVVISIHCNFYYWFLSVPFQLDNQLAKHCSCAVAIAVSRGWVRISHAERRGGPRGKGRGGGISSRDAEYFSIPPALQVS
jgi:hypothetical protein